MAAGRSLAELTAEDFRRFQGQRFGMTVPTPRGEQAPAMKAELVEVTEHPRAALGSFRTPFALVFHGPSEPVLPQGMYRLEHQDLGVLELFLVPIGPDLPAEPEGRPAGMRYEAVFG